MSSKKPSRDQQVDFDDGWETEEEELVHVELSGIFQDDLRRDPDLVCKFIGLDREEPLVQLGNQIFSGRFEDTVGTSVFFKQGVISDEEAAKKDPVFDRSSDNKIDYLCKTDTKLVLKRVFLNAKTKQQQQTEAILKKKT